MKQIFKTCGNTYKVFYHIIAVEIFKSYKIVPKDLCMKNDYCIGNPSTKFFTTCARKGWIINCDYAICWFKKILVNCLNWDTILVRSSKSLKQMFISCSNLGFILIELLKKLKLENLRSHSPSFVYKKFLIERF